MKYKRVVILVLDSLGVGELPDAKDYNDLGADTLGHTYEKLNGLTIPRLEKIGLLQFLKNSELSQPIEAYWSRMKESSRGKDTATGHWEMMGIVMKVPFQTFLEGFPEDLMQAWMKETGLGYLGNKAASGTVIIDELGAEHLKTLNPIVYTSADSVFQIAAHEKYFGLKKLHDLCAQTREFLNKSKYQVGRVIARPFIGEVESFKRTGNRKDYALSPFTPTALDHLQEAGVSTIGIGKIPSIYNYRGISKEYEAHNDDEAIDATIKALQTETQAGVIFTNLNDLDMLYGHRRNTEGYGKQIEHIDSRLNEILSQLTDQDLLIITADHGNDPTYRGTDHTREYVPLLVWNSQFKPVAAEKRKLPERECFSDIGQSILENFGVKPLATGKSFLAEISQ